MISVLEAIWIVLLTFAIAAFCAIAKPTRFRCPRGFYAEGVRPDGRTTCRLVSRTPEVDCRGDRPCPGGEIDPGFGARVFCTGGATPIVVDHRTVGCQRGGWQ